MTIKQICLLCKIRGIRSELHPMYYRASDGKFKRLGHRFWCEVCEADDDLAYLYTKEPQEVT
ncbi:unnamed protein product [marine sediment metagenome]|uniref:Uncharacterized protein n=1 Tax=marine sediment metagenome TaxID=412755 RepID=X1KVH4_9ZZZZ